MSFELKGKETQPSIRIEPLSQDEKEKARQVRFLVARGYSFGLALRVLKQGSASVEE